MGFQCLLSHQVCLYSEESGNAALKPDEPGKSHGTPHFYKNIYVAVRILLPSDIRTEYSQFFQSVSFPQLFSVIPDYFFYVFECFQFVIPLFISFLPDPCRTGFATPSAKFDFRPGLLLPAGLPCRTGFATPSAKF